MSLAKWTLLTAAVFSLSRAESLSEKRLAPKSISTTLSRVSDGISSQGNSWNKNISLSENGRYVVFESAASNLVSGDDNGVSDVFLYDTQTSTMTLLSVGLSSQAANGPSYDPRISDDGNYVVFASFATNLVASDTNAKSDVFRVTLSSGSISRVSLTNAGAQADGASAEPSVSGDGNLVVFTSNSTNLVASDTNDVEDVFVRNISGGTTVRVSQSSSSVQGDKGSHDGRVSSDGSSIAFVSDATNLVASDSNACSDVFVRDLSGSTTALVSSSSAGTFGNRSSYSPDISDDGQFVVFQSRANNLIASDTNGYIDVFIKDRSTGTTSLISQTDAATQVIYDSGRPSISHDGRFVVFESQSPGFVGYDSNNVVDVFVRDRLSELTTPFSTIAANGIGNGKSISARISGDSSKFGFISAATNLVSPDINGQTDVFLRSNPLTGQVVNVIAAGGIAEAGGVQPSFNFIRYGSTAGSLVVNYSIAGTASAGVDYASLSGVVTFASSVGSVTISVSPVSDTEVELGETIQVSLSENVTYFIGGKPLASVTIADDDQFELSIAATDNVVFEDGVNRGNFRISRLGGTLGDLTVNLSASGSATSGADYVGLPTTAVIPAGQAYADISVIGLEDVSREGEETVSVSLQSGTGYTLGSPSFDVATIKDNDSYDVDLLAIDALITEGSTADLGTFRVTRTVSTSESLVVAYAIKGTAQNGVDYQSLSGLVTIAASTQYTDVSVTSIGDALREDYESIILQLLPGGLYNLGSSQEATLVIKEDLDLPVVSIEATDSNASESGSDSGTIRISRTGSTATSLTVAYSVGGTALNGTDYSSVSGIATIGAGQVYLDLSINGIEDAIVESTETAVLALNSSSAYYVDVVSSMAQVNISDNDTATVQIRRESSFSTENQRTKAKITVYRDGDLSASLPVGISFSGSATVSSDFTNPGSAITIPAGESSKSFEIVGIDDIDVEGTESVVINIASSIAYAIGDSDFTKISIVDHPVRVFADIIEVSPDSEINDISVSDSGRYIAFASAASNLLSAGQDSNGVSDIFIVDTTLGTVTRVNGPGGVQPNGASRGPKISADGNFVVFSSKASNFYQWDFNQYEDIYLVEIATGQITYVSKGYTAVSEGGDSLNPSISKTGEYIVFESSASNLVLNDHLGTDIFLFIRSTGQLEAVNRKAGGAAFTVGVGSHRPSVSNDGNLITFESTEQIGGDTDVYTDILLRNRQGNTLKRVSFPVSGTANNGSSSRSAISGNGTSVVFQSASSLLKTGDLNSTIDVFRYMVINESTELLSTSSAGQPGNKSSVFSSINLDGDQTVFVSSSTNFGGDFNCTTSAYVKSQSQGTILPIENGAPFNCSAPVREAVISSSGSYIVSTVASSSGFRDILISGNPLN